MANPTALEKVPRFDLEWVGGEPGPDLGYQLVPRENGYYVTYESYQRTLSEALQYKHELEQCQLDLKQHQGNASEVIRLQAEVAQLRETLAVRDRENGAIAEAYLSKLGIKPEDLR